MQTREFMVFKASKAGLPEVSSTKGTLQRQMPRAAIEWPARRAHALETEFAHAVPGASCPPQQNLILGLIFPHQKRAGGRWMGTGAGKMHCLLPGR